jgi:hypothetical protein
MVGLISNIASQTNLLALNATIEATDFLDGNPQLLGSRGDRADIGGGFLGRRGDGRGLRGRLGGGCGHLLRGGLQLGRRGRHHPDDAAEEAEVRRRADEAAAAERKRTMVELADGFEAAVGGIVGMVSASATELQATAQQMTRRPGRPHRSRRRGRPP